MSGVASFSGMSALLLPRTFCTATNRRRSPNRSGNPSSIAAGATNARLLSPAVGLFAL